MTKPDFPVFDADNHLYETGGRAHPPPSPRYAHPIRFVEINGRKKLGGHGNAHRVHPEPDLRGGRPPRARTCLLRRENPRASAPGAEPASRSSASRRSASPRPGSSSTSRASTRARVPDARQPDRGTRRRRPRPHPGRDPRSTSGSTTSGPTTTRAGSSPRRSSPCLVDEAITELEWPRTGPRSC